MNKASLKCAPKRERSMISGTDRVLLPLGLDAVHDVQRADKHEVLQTLLDRKVFNKWKGNVQDVLSDMIGNAKNLIFTHPDFNGNFTDISTVLCR